MEFDERVNKLTLLQERDNDRKIDIQKKKNDRNLLSAENEKVEFFQNTYKLHKNKINDSLNKAVDIPVNELPDFFNDISKQILILQKYIASSNIFLRCYDIQKYQHDLQVLNTVAKELEDKLLPKRKFGFKNRKNMNNDSNPSSSSSNYKNGKDQRDVVDFTTSSFGTVFGFINKSNENLIMERNEIQKKDVTIEHLDNCKVKLMGSPSTLHINDLKNCTLFCGPVSTSIFADNCENCILVISCQQLRLHSSTNVKIYLHVTSRAIMEDCNNIQIAPYNWLYDGIDSDFEVSGLDNEVNNWKNVDDFNWLNVEKPSPNWCVLDENERVSEWKEID